MDKLDSGDIIFMAGAIGLADESIQEENQFDNDVEDPIGLLDPPVERNNVNVRLFRNGHPELYDHIVETIAKQRVEWAESKRIKAEVQHELDALDECERILRDTEDEKR